MNQLWNRDDDALRQNKTTTAEQTYGDGYLLIVCRDGVRSLPSWWWCGHPRVVIANTHDLWTAKRPSRRSRRSRPLSVSLACLHGTHHCQKLLLFLFVCVCLLIAICIFLHGVATIITIASKMMMMMMMWDSQWVTSLASASISLAREDPTHAARIAMGRWCDSLNMSESYYLSIIFELSGILLPQHSSETLSEFS